MKPIYVIVLLLVALFVSSCNASVTPSEVLKDVEEHFKTGIEYQEQERWEEAIAEYHEVIRLNQQYIDAYVNRGIAYRYLGQFRRAIEDYNRAIYLEPQNANALAHRAITYTILSKDEEAEKDIERAIKLGFPSSLLRDEIERLKDTR